MRNRSHSSTDAPMASSHVEKPCQQIRVAIVGTGLAGLTTAYLLHHDLEKRYRVTLFEQGDSLSFDAASVAVRNEETAVAERIDLPMRAIAGGYYSNLLRMYRYLSIPMHPIRFLFVFAKASPKADASSSTAGSVPGSYFIHASNLHQMPPPWPGTRGVMSHLMEVLYLLVCYFWFSVACFFIQPLGGSSNSSSSERDESFADYLERIKLPRRYISHYLIPLMSSVSTCSHQEMLAFPASDVVNYKKLSHWQQHYTVCGGVSQVQLRLAYGLKDIRLGSRVIDVVPAKRNLGVTLRWRSTTHESGGVEEDTFDRVVLAVSPDVAGTIFSPLKSLVSKIPTRQVESSVLSFDETRGHQGAVSVVDVSSQPMTCSHHLRDTFPAQTIVFKTLFSDSNGSQTEALHTMPGGVVVSTCPLDTFANSKRSLKTARFTRTLRTTESRAVINRIMGAPRKTDKKVDDDDGAELTWANGEDNVWLTGGWCWDGMVLLEGCIVSAMRVADDFGATVPW